MLVEHVRHTQFRTYYNEMMTSKVSKRENLKTTNRKALVPPKLPEEKQSKEQYSKQQMDSI